MSNDGYLSVDRPSGSDYARHDSAENRESLVELQKRVRRIEEHLGLHPSIPKRIEADDYPGRTKREMVMGKTYHSSTGVFGVAGEDIPAFSLLTIDAEGKFWKRK